MSKFDDTLNQINPQQLIDKALTKGASYADFRYQVANSEEILVENKSLEGYKSRNFGGIGIRVVVNGAVGFASTSNLAKENINKTLDTAYNLAKAFESNKGNFADTKKTKLVEKVPIKIDPNDISPEEKVKLLMETNKAAYISDEIKNVITVFGSGVDHRYFLSSDGSETEITVPSIGLLQVTIAKANGKMEAINHRKGGCTGYELFQKTDWNKFAVDLGELAIRNVKADAPPAGTYPVIVDPHLVGILTHEAFGHAAEADFVFTGTSTLKDRLGEQLCSEQVTIVDEGVVKDGYHIPFDDEGTPKGKTIIVGEGVMKSYIHDRNSAKELAVKPSGNSRAQDFQNQPIVRMTNTYIDKGTYKFDELLEGVKEGVYIKSKGSGGGQVEVGMGTFTFDGGESFMIRNGELAEPVRGVVISGAILDTLKTVDAVGNDLELATGYFGACGKGGQAAKVGFGGPHIRVQEMTVGGK